MTTVQRYARTAGVLLIVSAVAGGFGEVFVPMSLVVPNDAAATAQNVIASVSLFRSGFAAYLVEAACDVSLTLVLYVLLRPAGEHLALLAVFFRLVSTAVFAAVEMFYFAALPILSGAEYLRTFTPGQLNALALLSLRLYGYGAGLYLALYGIASILLGYLMIRSGYLPRPLGALLAIAGLGFVAYDFLLVLAPAYASFLFYLPTGVAGLALAAWLLVRGVDAAKWEERTAAIS